MNEYYGKYRAFVRDVNDPEQRGRIRIYCPGVMGTKDNKGNWLDWALPCFPPNTFILPKVGDGVWIEFEMGEASYPIWVGNWLSGESANTSEAPQEAKTGYPVNGVTQLPEGDLVFGTKSGKTVIPGDEVHLAATLEGLATQQAILGTKFRELQKEMNTGVTGLSTQFAQIAASFTAIGAAIAAFSTAMGAASSTVLLPTAAVALATAAGTFGTAGAAATATGTSAALAAKAAVDAFEAQAAANQNILSNKVKLK